MGYRVSNLDTDLEPRRARGRPRIEDLEELKARLVRVARRLFIRRGYGASSMSEIARVARVSKGTLYARFPTKADIFRAIIDDEIKTSSGRMSLIFDEAATLEELLLEFAEATIQCNMYSDVMQINRLIYSESMRFPELGAAAWASTRMRVDIITQTIAKYAELENIPCKSPEQAADTFTTLLRGINSDLLLRGTPPVEEDVLADMRPKIALFLAGRKDW